MWGTSSKSIGRRWPFALALCFFFFSTPATSSAQSLPQAGESSLSSSDLLQAVQVLRDYLKDRPQDSALTTVLTFYRRTLEADKTRWEKQSTLLTTLSKSWDEEKAKILRDDLTIGVLSFGGGFLAGRFSPKR